MNVFLELLVLAFATVALIAFGLWVFRGGFAMPWKVVGVLCTIFLWWAMCNAPLGGRLESDHGALTDFVATFGIAIVGSWGLRRVGNDWRHQTAIVVSALALLLLMWVPRFEAGELTLPRSSPPSAAVPVSVSPTDPSPPPIPSRPSSHVHSGEIDCSLITLPDHREAANCP